MDNDSILEATGGHLFIPQAHLNPERQHEFTRALDTGKAVWYQQNCWTVIAQHGEAAGQRLFVLAQVPDRECQQPQATDSSSAK